MLDFFGAIARVFMEFLCIICIEDERLKKERRIPSHNPRPGRRGRPDALHDDEYYREWQERQGRKHHE